MPPVNFVYLKDEIFTQPSECMSEWKGWFNVMCWLFVISHIGVCVSEEDRERERGAKNEIRKEEKTKDMNSIEATSLLLDDSTLISDRRLFFVLKNQKPSEHFAFFC